MNLIQATTTLSHSTLTLIIAPDKSVLPSILYYESVLWAKCLNVKHKSINLWKISMKTTKNLIIFPHNLNEDWEYVLNYFLKFGNTLGKWSKHSNFKLFACLLIKKIPK